MADQGTQIQGQSLDKPLSFRGKDVKHDDFKISRTPYLLEMHEFYILTRSTSDLKEWQKRMLQIGIGVCLTILSKTIYFIFLLSTIIDIKEREKISLSVTGWEAISLIIAFGSWLILLRINLRSKNEKNILIESINTFFTK